MLYLRNDSTELHQIWQKSSESQGKLVGGATLATPTSHDVTGVIKFKMGICYI